MPQQLLQTDILSQCRLEMFEGIEVISRHQLFRQVLSDELGPEAASVLAEPVKNVERDSIAWYTDLPGAAVHFQDLNEEERLRLREEVDRRAGQFAELAAGFKTASTSNRVLAGDLLAKVLSRVDSYDLYLVGGQAVVVGWGISSRRGRAEGGDRAKNQAAAPSRPAAVLADPPPPPSAASGRLRLLAYLLLGLLAGGLLAWLLTHFFLPGFWSKWLNLPAADWPGFELNQGREADLRLELERLKRLYNERRAACRPEPELKPEPEPVPEPSVPEPEPEMKPEPEPEPPVLEPKPDESLEIPENALKHNDFSFLDGCWASKADDLISEKTRRPVIFIYCFDKNGRASVRVEEKDAQGRRLDTCRTTASAEAGDKKLIIKQHGPAMCGQGGGYSRATVLCEPNPAGGVECRFEQDGSKLRPRAGFTRIEE